ncbi:MAG: protein kinase [Gammaproteobacteria bacterium]
MRKKNSVLHRNSLKPGYKLHWYEIKEILGQGGFGITYLAYDSNLDKYVAIKEYLPIELAVRVGDFSVHPVSENHGKQYTWGLERFITEARTLARFEHPDIVRVLAVFEENNTGYMVMAYEQGQSLQEKLAGKKTLEETELLKILIPILGGLEVVHKAGFIHRDIKPDNIFIRNDGSPVLLDFGSARQALGEQTKTLTSLVTPGYAPFEQYFSKSDEQGPWTDIYGLGATLYRAVAGVVPLDAVDRSKAILEGRKDVFVPVVEIGRGTYSGRFLKAIDHAIQFKKQDRPQTISEWKRDFDLANELDEINRINNFEKRPTEPGTSLVKERKSRPRYLPIFVILILIILLVGYYRRNTLNEWLSDYAPVVVKFIKGGMQTEEKELALARQLTREQVRLQRRQQEIDALILKAETAFNAGNYLEPQGSNSLEIYLHVLEIDPGNAAAIDGKRQILEHFLQMAIALMSENNFDEADRALLKADIAGPDSREIKLARLKLQEKKAEADKIALELEKKRQEQERKRKEEKRRLAELEREKQQEREKKRIEEENRLKEEQRLAELERQQIEQENARKAREEAQRKADAERERKIDQQVVEIESAVKTLDLKLAENRYTEARTLFPDSDKIKAWNTKIKEVKVEICKKLVGQWAMHYGGWNLKIVFSEDHSLNAKWLFANSGGSWRCLDPYKREFSFTLDAKGGGNIVMDPGGDSLNGNSRWVGSISAVRGSGK